MKVDISDIMKTPGASAGVDFNGFPETMEMLDGEFSFKDPIRFNGKLVNVNGTLKLTGHLKADYMVKCYRCLKEVSGSVNIGIEENFVNSGTVQNYDSEAYLYDGNWVELDKVFTDHILLNLPMKKICTESCKGLCPKCGSDLNIKQCECCRTEEPNPRMKGLEKFFEN